MSWIGWLTRPRKVEEKENTFSPMPLETTPSLATPPVSSTTNSPSKTRLYPSLNSSSTTPSAPLLSDAIRDDWVDEASAAQKKSNSRIAEKKLTENELAKIKEENERLKSVLQKINLNQTSSSTSSSSSCSSAPYSFQHVGHIPGGNGFLLSIPSISTPTASNPFAPSAPPSTSSTSIPQEKVKEKSEDGSVLCHGDLSTVVIKQLKEEENEKENAVALLDLKEMDWWVMVNGAEGVEKSSSSRSPSSSLSTCVEVEDDGGVQREGGLRIVKSHLTYDDEGYVLIDENDFIQALSDFISQSIARQYPEAEKIPPQELQRVLRQAFTPIKQPSSLGKAYQWAQFLYQSYSWGSCAWSLYREPFYVKLVLRGAMKAAQWLLVLVI